MVDKRFIGRTLAVILIIAGLATAAFIAYRNSDKDDQPLIFADRTMLAALWNDYKQEYWEEKTGRTLDKERNSITTSEGQSYTMLRAVWQSDKATFDKTWEWTQEQLQREDKLFAWKWGQKPDGSYGILEGEGGKNTASDADVDIALALLMAAGRWQQESYINEAREIIPQIWEVEVATVNGKPYLTANNLEKNSDKDSLVINPSYFAPYAYREFARIDNKHEWNQLVDSSYELINRSIEEDLDKTKSGGLPPDWVSMNKESGALKAINSPNLTTNYSFDAFRTPWRLALDHQWNDEPRAKETLSKFNVLNQDWQQEGKIYSTYSHDGEPIKKEESPAAYGANLGYFIVVNPDIADQVYEQKLKTLYDPNGNQWAGDISYYSDNWAWFGMALYNEQLDNPTRSIKRVGKL